MSDPYVIRFEKAAEKFLRKQTPKTQQNLMKTIYRLPDGTDIKRLKDMTFIEYGWVI